MNTNDANLTANLDQIHQEPGGQVALYQAEDRYYNYLGRLFGERFRTYRRRWSESSQRLDHGLFPLSLDLAINSGCQLACFMCPLASRPAMRKVQLMDETLYQNIMAQAREHELAALTLGLASEPLLNPRVARWISTAVSAGIMDIRLGTNGLALTEKLTKALIDSGLTRLEISVDAADPNTYKAIRGGCFTDLIANIERFMELRQKAGQEAPLLRLSFLNLDINQGERELFLARWQHEADLISLQEPIWFPGAKWERPAKAMRPLAPTCAQPWQRLGINYDGHLWPCCSWYGEELLTLNAQHIPLAAAWNGPEMNELRCALSGNEKHPPLCQQCEY